MPVMNGFQATEKLRQMIAENELDLELTIIAITADPIDKDMKAKCKKVGFDKLYGKPVSL